MQDTTGPFSGTLVVVGLDGQALAQSAARSGLRPVVLDARGGTDLLRSSQAYRRIARNHPYGGLDSASLLNGMDKLCPERGCLGVVYSHGFEHNPALLHRISDNRRLYGNSPETVALARDPHAFFPLLDSLGITHPAIGAQRPPSHGPWLSKMLGGSGGDHIRGVNPLQGYQQAPNRYYQQHLKGRSLSVMLIGDGQHCRVLGVSEKWTIPKQHVTHHSAPFLPGGAISDAPLERPLRDQLHALADTLCSAMGLIGINSIEVIVSGDKLSVIKVTPCPDATLSLYDHRYPGGLFAHHLCACRGSLPVVNDNGAMARGHSYVYLPGPINNTTGWRWPWWSSNHSDAFASSNTGLRGGDHLCTVNASGANPASVRARLRQREHELLAGLVSVRLTA